MCWVIKVFVCAIVVECCRCSVIMGKGGECANSAAWQVCSCSDEAVRRYRAAGGFRHSLGRRRWRRRGRWCWRQARGTRACYWCWGRLLSTQSSTLLIRNTPEVWLEKWKSTQEAFRQNLFLPFCICMRVSEPKMALSRLMLLFVRKALNSALLCGDTASSCLE